MRFITASILIFTASIAYAGIAGFLTKESRDWQFIQSVGGMKISLKGETLNVDCDVSGLKAITVKPTMVNSGIGVRQLKHKQFGKTIQLSLVTSIFEKGMTSSCKALDLSAYPHGEYAVQYLDPDGTTHPLGKIALKKQAKGEQDAGGERD
jgi:hypothetical protein